MSNIFENMDIPRDLENIYVCIIKMIYFKKAAPK